MSIKDRTSEFLNIVQSQKQRRNIVVQKHAQNPERAQRSEFNRMAKAIQGDINSTFTKLEKLTLLAKKKSLFDDRPVEIQELTYIIKQDIAALNQQIARLRQYQQARGGGGGGKQQQEEAHSTNVVFSLQSRLATMSNSFKDTLELRTKNLQEQRTRQAEFSSRNNSAASLIQPTDSTSALYRVDHSLTQRHSTGNGSPHEAIDMGPPADPLAYQQMQIMEQNNSYIQDRSAAVDQINKTIAELGSIFTQLAGMVHEQGQMVQRIDDNVLDAELNIEMAHSELLKYFASVSSNRWLMIKIFTVLMLFFIFFVVFVA
eukprot:comp31728_c0_seq1/m.47260 comp31728_c0_seq1/g.47260  ORF comp31728_c0_seq1/g.47260 comp31728_c0_seq1/m.47260 type:complete len:316 (-) comp31728_c0_seq1:450-1397(-)